MTLATTRQRVRVVAAVAAVTVLIVGLHALSSLGLEGPTGLGRAELDAWLNDPVIVLSTVLRWGALAMAYYLATVILAVALFSEHIETTPLRYLIPPRFAGTIGVVLGFSAVAVPFAAHLHSASSSAPVAAHDEIQLTQLSEPPTLRHITSSVAPVAEASAPQQSSSHARSQVRDVAGRTETWMVAPGDSFWTIAEEHLADALDRTDLSDAEIADYWRTLIAANDDRLVESGNPDLLYPGQVLILPEAPAPNR